MLVFHRGVKETENIHIYETEIHFSLLFHSKITQNDQCTLIISPLIDLLLQLPEAELWLYIWGKGVKFVVSQSNNPADI